MKAPWEGKDTAYRMAFAETPDQAPGSGFVYSDINFIVLGALVEKVSGETLDAYTAEHIFAPLKMIAYAVCASDIVAGENRAYPV